MKKRRWIGLAMLAAALVVALGLAPRPALAEGEVAQIGENKYQTLEEAIGAVPANGTRTTITLIDDATIDKPTTLSAGTNITLDLAGHTVTASRAILARGTLVIKDTSGDAGTISGAVLGLLQVNSPKAVVTLEGGTIETSRANAVSVTAGGAQFSMTGGELKAPEGSIALGLQNGTTSIVGGVVNGDVALDNTAALSSPALTVGAAGGYDSPIINGNVVSDLKNATVNLVGGTIGGVTGTLPAGSTLTSHFSSDISNALPDSGMQCVQQDGQWVVVKLTEENAGAKIVHANGTSDYYANAAIAFAQLGDGDTLILYRDAEASLSVAGGITATVDLNGCTLSSDAAAVLRLTGSNTNLTVKRGGIVSTSADEAASIVGVYGSGGAGISNVTLTLEDVDLSMEHSGNAGVIVQGLNTNNTVTLDGCTLTVPNDVMGIYFPPAKSALTVKDTAITAGTGIGLKGGTLVISGSTAIHATGANDPEGVPEGGGIAETGAAIYVDGGYVDREVSLSVSGGTFTSERGSAIQELVSPGRPAATPVTIEVSGGSFSDTSVLDYLTDGHSVATASDGSLVVAEGGAFEVGGAEYATLAEAVEAAPAGATITMLKSTVTEPVVIEKGVTLDLGGNTLTLVGTGAQDETALRFSDGASAIENGTVYDARASVRTFSVVAEGQGTSLVMRDVALTVEVPQSGDTYAVRVLNGADFTLDAGAAISEQQVEGRSGYTYGITVYGPDSEATIDPATASTVTVNAGASVESYAFAVSGNGDGKKHNTIVTVNGGTLTSVAGPAIYNPQYGRVVVSGGTVAGCSGIEIRAGELVVTGGTIAGDTEKTVVYPKESIGGGNSVDGGGIVVAQHSTKLPLTVSVTGGSVTANTAFIQHNVMGNDQASIDKIELSVTGGEFVGALRSDSFTDVDGKGFVSGGSFSSNEVGDLLAPESAVVVGDGETPFGVYPSEEEALANGGGYKVVDEQGNAWIFSTAEAAGDFAESLAGDTAVETVSHIVTFDDCLASTENAKVSVVNGEPVPRPAIDPALEGYRFLGWYEVTDGAYAAESYDFSQPVRADLTLYAQWEKIVVDEQPGDEKPEQPETPETPTPDAPSAQADALADTGDVMLLAPLASTLAAGVAALGAGLVLRRRNR